jgi:hypothetical protein
VPGVDSVVPSPRVDLTSDAEVALSASAVDAFVTALGGRQALVTILQIGSGDPLVDRLIALLDDPLYGGWSLKRLCAHTGLTVAEFLKAYQRAMVARSEIAATKIIADRIPAVIDDVLRRAAPHDAPCPCSPPGVAPVPTCVACHGSGTRQILPDLDRQKVALQLAKLLAQPGGPLVQTTTNTLVAPTGSGPTILAQGSLADLSTAVADLLKPRRALAPAPAPISDAVVEAPS